MSYAVQLRDRQARLPRIDFPGMDVERCRLTAFAGFAKCATYHRQRELAKVPSSRRRHRVAEDFRRRQRKLRELTPRPLNDVRSSLRRRIAVATAPNRKETGVVAVTSLDQGIERPFPSRNDRKAWCAIAKYARSRDVFQLALC